MPKLLTVFSDPAGADVPYLFEDLPVAMAPGAGTAEKVTGYWGPLLAGRDVAKVMEEYFQSQCKVLEPQPPLLVVKKGGPAGQEIPVDADPFTIGRKKDNRLVIAEVGTSGLHAKLFLDDDQWLLMDAGSVNGTSLNSRWLEKNVPQPLKNGDVIGIMESEFLFRVPDSLFRAPVVGFSFRGYQPAAALKDAADLTGARFALHGSSQFLHLVVSNDLIRLWLASLVGIRYTVKDLNAPLGDVEKGLYEYMLLKLLQMFQKKVWPEAGPQWWLAGLDSPARPSAFAAENVAACFLTAFERQEGDIWVVFPASAMDEWTALGKDGLPGAPAGREYWRRCTRGWEWLKLPLTVRLGAIELSPAELLSLEPGDIVLMPPGVLQGNPEEGLRGPVAVTPAGGRRVSGQADLAVAEGRYQIAFKSFHPISEEVQMEQKQPTPPPADTPNVEEPAGELMKDVSLSLVVELDRVSVNLDQLVQLAPGQVIGLQRPPGSPVDLSINGRIVGRGQLVLINGELGVKIITIKR